MATDVLYFDGVDAETAYGFAVTALPGAWSMAPTEWETVTVPQYDGAILRRTSAQVGARTIEVSGLIRGTDADDAEVKVNALKDALFGRSVEISYGFQTGTRSYVGVLQGLEAGLFAPGNLGGWVSVTLSFLCPDPYAQDDTPTVTAGTAGVPVAVQVGTGPSWPVVEISGPAVTPTLTFKNSAGVTIGTMVFTNNLAGSGNKFIVNPQAFTVVNELGVSQMANLAAGYAFPVFSPRDGVRATSSWPTVTCSSGPTLITYVKRWL